MWRVVKEQRVGVLLLGPPFSLLRSVTPRSRTPAGGVCQRSKNESAASKCSKRLCKRNQKRHGRTVLLMVPKPTCSLIVHHTLSNDVRDLVRLPPST